MSGRAYPLTVYYDASCPMCASEVHALRDLAGSGRLKLVDCSAPEFDDAGFIGEGLTRADFMRLMHVRDARGRWYVAIDAFEVLYRAAGLEGAARLWGHPRWRPLLERIYPWIARHRQLLSALGMNALVRTFIPRR